jgi:hypothetical protein
MSLSFALCVHRATSVLPNLVFSAVWKLLLYFCETTPPVLPYFVLYVGIRVTLACCVPQDSVTFLSKLPNALAQKLAGEPV